MRALEPAKNLAGSNGPIGPNLGGTPHHRSVRAAVAPEVQAEVVRRAESSCDDHISVTGDRRLDRLIALHGVDRRGRPQPRSALPRNLVGDELCPARGDTVVAREKEVSGGVDRNALRRRLESAGGQNPSRRSPERGSGTGVVFQSDKSIVSAGIDDVVAVCSNGGSGWERDVCGNDRSPENGSVHTRVLHGRDSALWRRSPGDAYVDVARQIHRRGSRPQGRAQVRPNHRTPEQGTRLALVFQRHVTRAREEPGDDDIPERINEDVGGIRGAGGGVIDLRRGPERLAG